METCELCVVASGKCGKSTHLWAAAILLYMKSGLLASDDYGGGGFACLICRLGGVRHDETRRQLEINCAEGAGEKRGEEGEKERKKIERKKLDGREF